MMQPEQQQQEPMPAEGGGAGNELSELVQNLGTGLSMFAEILSAASPELGQEAQAIEQGFMGLVQKMSGGPIPAQGGVSPEQGRGNAIPIGR